jgi:YD repeat-containing protein
VNSRYDLSALMLANLPRQTLFRFFAHLLVRLLVVTSLPQSLQPYTALLPVSMLWTLVRYTSSEVDGARTTAFTWDANGNQTSKIVGGVTTAYVYDARDKLIEAKQGAGTLSCYSYDFRCSPGSTGRGACRG